MKFTPGPWSVQARLCNMIDVTHSNTQKGAITHSLCRVQARVSWVEEATANAHLIAAAPDMYAALKRAAALLVGNSTSLADEIRAALKKAEGL